MEQNLTPTNDELDTGDDVEGHGLREKTAQAAIALSVLVPAATVVSQAVAPTAAHAGMLCPDRGCGGGGEEPNHAEGLVDGDDDVEGHGLREKTAQAAIALSVLVPAATVVAQVVSPTAAHAAISCP